MVYGAAQVRREWRLQRPTPLVHRVEEQPARSTPYSDISCRSRESILRPSQAMPIYSLVPLTIAPQSLQPPGKCCPRCADRTLITVYLSQQRQWGARVCFAVHGSNLGQQRKSLVILHLPTTHNPLFIFRWSHIYLCRHLSRVSVSKVLRPNPLVRFSLGASHVTWAVSLRSSHFDMAVIAR